MIYKGKEISSRAIDKLLGEPIVFNISKPVITGSPSLFLKRFESKINKEHELQMDSKCNFEKRPKGLLLRANYSNKLSMIALPLSDISSIILTKGEELVQPIKYSPFWFLLKWGVSLNIARYFARNAEYYLDQIELVINSINYRCEFIASGYLFKRHCDFFTSLSYDSRLTVNQD